MIEGRMMRNLIFGLATMIFVFGCTDEPTLKYVYHTYKFDEVVIGMGYYKDVTDNSESSIANLYEHGFISKVAELKFKELTHCQNLEGIKIRMEQLDDFVLELDSDICFDEPKRKGKFLVVSEDGKKISVANGED